METCKARVSSVKIGFQFQISMLHSSYITVAQNFGQYHYKSQPDKYM